MNVIGHIANRHAETRNPKRDVNMVIHISSSIGRVQGVDPAMHSYIESVVRFIEVIAVTIVGTLGYLFPLNVITRVLGQSTLAEIGDRELKQLEARNEKIPPNFNKIIEVEGIASGKLRWFTEIENRTKSDPVLLFFHGGGYALWFRQHHASLLTYIWQHLPNYRLSIVWLDYTLSRKARYPQQLVEAALSYQALQATSNNIILMGDSAGGNLSINLLRHLYKPFDDIPRVPSPVKPSSTILISPWLQLEAPKPIHPESSFHKYRWRDIVSAKLLDEMSEQFLPAKESRDQWISTYNDTSVEWTKVLPPAVKIFISIGGVEILQDGIEAFIKCAAIDVRGGRIYTEPYGIHDSPIVLGPKRSLVPREIVAFLKSTLKPE